MVGGGEALVVEPSRTAGGDNDGLGLGDEQLLGFHVEEDRAGGFSVFIQDQLDGGGEVHHGDLPVEDLVPEGTHDLGAGVVLGSVHPLAGGAAAVGAAVL